MSIDKKEQIRVNNEASKILKEYLSMLYHQAVVQRKINELLHTRLDKPLTMVSLMNPDLKGLDSKCYKILVSKYISYTAQAEQCKYKMIELFKPIVNHIIETKYTPYLKHREALYRIGLSGILLSMDQICPDPYAYYCQRIIVEMHRFLDDDGLIKK